MATKCTHTRSCYREAWHLLFLLARSQGLQGSVGSCEAKHDGVAASPTSCYGEGVPTKDKRGHERRLFLFPRLVLLDRWGLSTNYSG